MGKVTNKIKEYRAGLIDLDGLIGFLKKFEWADSGPILSPEDKALVEADPRMMENFDWVPNEVDTWYEMIEAEDDGLLTPEEYAQVMVGMFGKKALR